MRGSVEFREARPDDLPEIGIGEALLRHAIEVAKREGCGLVRLTTDRRRTQAHCFYERLGFAASHVGMKLDLASGSQADS